MSGSVSNEIPEDLGRNRGRRISAHEHNHVDVAQTNRDENRKDRMDTLHIRRHHASTQLELLSHEARHTDLGQLRQGHSLLAQVKSHLERHGLHQNALSEQAHHMLHRRQRGHTHVALLSPQHLRLAQALAFQRCLCAHAQRSHQARAQGPFSPMVAHARSRAQRRVRRSARRDLARDWQTRALLFVHRRLGLRGHRGYDHQRRRRQVSNQSDNNLAQDCYLNIF